MPAPWNHLPWAIGFWIGYVLVFSLEARWIFRRRGPNVTGSRDRGGLAAIGILFIALALAFWFADRVRDLFLGWQPLVWFFLGLTLMLAGCALRQWAMSALRRCAVEATVVKPCEWAAAGPYRRLRHPACAGALLLWAGLGLALTNGASLLTLALTAVLAYGLRIRAEEAARSATFGESYRAYCLRTPRLFPRILRKTS